MDVESDYDAAILDLDGVITRTAGVHARAWKRTFDEYLRVREARGEGEFVEFDLESDYRRHIDGKPRYDGVRDFLAARRIVLPEGDPGDGPSLETVCGLGNRKNVLFNEILRSEGVEVYEDAAELVREWRARGLKTAVVSSSKNCGPVLAAAGLSDLFGVKVDGVEGERLGLLGKPAPDFFLEAARRLDVVPSRAVVFEDAVSGVRAGRAGGFACVVGVDRSGEMAEELLESGADLVVSDLRQLRFGDESGENVGESR